MDGRLLPLFPLPVVLFPGVPLPLHIFEPRYRTMLADCMEGDRRFGILYRPDEAGELALEPGHVGCVAHVESTQPLPDGRSNIIVTGEERFELARCVASSHPCHMDALLTTAVDTLESRATSHESAKSNGHGPTASA